MQVLQLHNSLAIAPYLTSQFGYGVIYARAISNFHGREWFSSVIFHMEENNERYGQLRLMFKSMSSLGRVLKSQKNWHY